MKYEDISKGCEINHLDKLIGYDRILYENDAPKCFLLNDHAHVDFGDKTWVFIYTEDATWMAMDEYEVIGL